uniref:Putative secreted protein n=1 Tax=Ixodes ricinus TaxID=34613 RepID=A0A6B0UIX6_IXORI
MKMLTEWITFGAMLLCSCNLRTSSSTSNSVMTRRQSTTTSITMATWNLVEWSRAVNFSRNVTRGLMSASDSRSISTEPKLLLGLSRTCTMLFGGSICRSMLPRSAVGIF